MEIKEEEGPPSLLCDHWLQILDDLNIGAFTVNLQRRVTSINYSAQALLGLHEEEVVAKDCREIFTGVPCMSRCLVRGQEEPETDEPDVELLDEKQGKHLVTRMASPVYGPSGNVVGCLTVLQDHSPIAQLIDRIRYEERSLKHILDSLDIGIFTTNRGGHITFFNHAAETITGYRREELLGKQCAHLFPKENGKGLDLLNASTADGNSRNCPEGRMLTKEDADIPVRATYTALRNEKGTVIGGLATFHDLTLIQQLKRAIDERYTFHDMMGKSPAMQKVFELAGMVAETDATVLIEGPTGTGKDLLAKAIHWAGKRADKPLVKVNCAAIPDNLLESEMFGYSKGAFTGAGQDKPGRFQEADGGTLFLDEIGDLPLRLQAKLLRVVEDREFYPLGGRYPVKVDVRILSASNRGLHALVEKRLFREDLFYRLNVFRIELPALKERSSDLPLLIRHLARRLSVGKGITQPEISGRAMAVLLDYHYPGNVRELENVLEHALIVSRGTVIEPEHLPGYLQHAGPRHGEGLFQIEGISMSQERTEREKIVRALREHKGNRKEAARVLGMDRTTLWRKMKRLAIVHQPLLRR